MMKKITVLITLVLLIGSVAGCSKKPDNSSTSSEVVITSSTDEPGETAIPATTDPLQVMDASQYRGEVEDIVKEKGKTLLIVAQADGRPFGPNRMKVTIDENTKLNFSIDELAVGHYLELYYGDIWASEGMEEIDVIAANLLGTVAMRVTNGTVTSVTPKEDKSGSITVIPLDGTEEIVFNFDRGTQFYLDFDTIKEGTELNIFHDMSMTKSIPPQMAAMEVSYYNAISA